MPLYEYRCSKCEKTFEVIQKFSDAPLTEHEGCGGSVERLLSAPAFQFKGSGWYVTDYAKSGSSDKGAGDKGAADKAAADKGGEKKSSSETKSESKPAETKTEAKGDSKPAASSTKTD
jgi:putative FmdB family regulatory protein